MTGQAKARASSPFWEGVVVLSNTNSQEQSANLQVWKSAYEKETGHKVLHMSVHLDEGYVDTHGKPQYNPHAHVIVSRMDEKNRVISLGRKQLANVQDLTAETLQMQRGSTLAERGGKRGRKHIPHREFRAQADEKRLGLDKSRADLARLHKLSMEWADTDLAKVKDLEKELAAAQIHIIQQAAEIVQLNEQYRRDREAFKASGEAKQADYQKLKIKHKADLENLEKDLVTAQVQAAQVPQLEAQINALKPEAAKVQGLEKQVTDARQDASNKAAKVVGLEANINQQIKAFDELKSEALAVITPLREEAKTMKAQITQLTEKNAQLAAETAKAKPQGTSAHLIVPSDASDLPIQQPRQAMAAEATRTTTEPLKQSSAHGPSPTQEKSLSERLGASLMAMLDWIKTIGAEQEPVTASSRHSGPVKHMDHLHCVQKTSRTGYAIHQLAHLDNIPALDDPKTEIQYRGGFGQVGGTLGQKPER